MTRTLILYLIVIFCNGILLAQTPIFAAQKIYDTQSREAYSIEYSIDANFRSATQKVDETLIKYSVFDLDIQAIKNHVRTKGPKSFKLDLDNEQVQLNIVLHDILSPDFKHYEQGPNGVIVHPKPEAFTYRGYTNDATENDVAIAIRRSNDFKVLEMIIAWFFIELKIAVIPHLNVKSGTVLPQVSFTIMSTIMTT